MSAPEAGKPPYNSNMYWLIGLGITERCHENKRIIRLHNLPTLVCLRGSKLYARSCTLHWHFGQLTVGNSAGCPTVGTGTCDWSFHGRYGSNTAGVNAPGEVPVAYTHQCHGRQVASSANQLGSYQVYLAGYSPTSHMPCCIYTPSASGKVHAYTVTQCILSLLFHTLHCLMVP